MIVIVTRYAEMSCSICRDMSTTWRLLLKCGSISDEPVQKDIAGHEKEKKETAPW